MRLGLEGPENQPDYIKELGFLACRKSLNGWVLLTFVWDWCEGWITGDHAGG